MNGHFLTERRDFQFLASCTGHSIAPAENSGSYEAVSIPESLAISFRFLNEV